MAEFSIKRILLRVVLAAAAISLLGTIVLVSYGLLVTNRAKSLLADVKALRVGESTEADAARFFEKHKESCSNRTCDQDYCVTRFEVTNRWLAKLKLEPHASFRVGYVVTSGRVTAINASLFRSMPIYPTFSASAGWVDEYAKYPDYLADRVEHYSFP